ncbi:VWA domain-containing protein [Kiritimatiellota bacterium B12222]|nr:VWA domain-containing protein [Kiritimatiellota bacterium B12222]
MITFAHPEAFFLIPVWGLLGWFLPKAGLWKPLRLVVILLLLVAWADPFVDRSTPGLDLWVLNDLSLSARETVQPQLPELETLLKESKGKHDRIFYVDFADDAIVRDSLSAAVLTGRKDASRIGNLLQFVLSQRKENRTTRLLLVSDGYSTDPVDLAGDRLLREGIPLDTRLMQAPAVQDVRVEGIEGPIRTRKGDPFILEAHLLGPTGSQAEVSLYRDGVELSRQAVAFQRGQARVQWTARLQVSGAARFEVRIATEGEDAYIENNQQVHWVEAAGENRILFLSAYADDPVAALLRARGYDVQLLTQFAGLNEGSLSGVGLVVIQNVHAADFPRAFLEALPFYVREQGGGLIMTGGQSSFGSGGYFESPVDKLLPVSMELKEEDHKLSTAMAIVMDRSGSMSAGTAGGMTKMDLANTGAARAIELLGDQDAIAVFAVDTAAHQILPLSQVGRHRGQLTSMVRRIQSTGGGIYVYNGLEAAWAQLKNAPQSQRHIILFADAADSEQPEGVGALIHEMRAHNTTVSVIALGYPTDPDAPFLEQIAEDGEGRLFFNDDANTLPAVFAQETVSVSRSAFLDEDTGVEARAGWQEVAALPLEWPASVNGYNLSYVREGASESLRSEDRYTAPLLSHWQRGAGKVAAVSFPLAGPYSENIRAWPQVGDFVSTLSRWSIRGETPTGIALRMRRMGETLRVQLYANEEWQRKFALTPPILVTERSGSSEVVTHAWRRIRPGMVETDLPLLSGERLRGAVKVGDEILPFGPVNGLAGAEWVMKAELPVQLRHLSTQSGGVERVDLAGIWDSPRRQVLKGTREFWLWACAAMFLFEAFWSRVGGQRIQVERMKKHRPVQENPEGKFESEAVLSPEQATGDRPRPRSAFQKARSQRR